MNTEPARIRRLSPACRDEHGFTLLEVLAAVALLAVAITVVLQLFSADLRSVSASGDYVAATARVNAKMREVLDSEEFTEKSWTDMTEDGFRMDITVAKALEERMENLPLQAFEVSVIATWSQGTRQKSITLKTLKLTEKKV